MSLRNLVLDPSTALGSTFNGNAISIDKSTGFAIAAVVDTASSLNGVLKMQGALTTGTPASTDWGDIDGATFTITADGCYLFNMDRQHLTWVRLVWTRTGGTGNVTTRFNENS
jgi:hypothetical protein